MGGRGSASKLNAQLSKAVSDEENKLVKYKREHATAFDDNGNVILRTTSNSVNHVGFTYSQIQKMDGATLTHNHPSNSTLSDDDVQFLTSTGIKTIRAAGKDTTYELTKENPNSRTKNFASDFKAVSNVNYNMLKAQASQINSDFRNRKISVDEYGKRIDALNGTLNNQNSQWLKDNASKYGCTYRVIKRR